MTKYTKETILIKSHTDILKQLFDYIIPESKSKKLPSASFLVVNELPFSQMDNSYFLDTINNLTAFAEIIYKKKILNMTNAELYNLIESFQKKHRRDFTLFAQKVMQYYYTNKTILDKLDIKRIPPFPHGNSIEETDLLIFGNVFLRGKIYRD